MDTDNHIFEQDTVLSADFFGDRSGPLTPERSLMLAVLEEAARCFLNYGSAQGKQRVLYDEASDWFASSERRRLYDFENICDVLGIEPDYLRRRLFEVRDRSQTATPPLAADTPVSAPTPAEDEPADDWQAAG
jgi:hypothetical protein